MATLKDSNKFSEFTRIIELQRSIFSNSFQSPITKIMDSPISKNAELDMFLRHYHSPVFDFSNDIQLTMKQALPLFQEEMQRANMLHQMLSQQINPICELNKVLLNDLNAAKTMNTIAQILNSIQTIKPDLIYENFLVSKLSQNIRALEISDYKTPAFNQLPQTMQNKISIEIEHQQSNVFLGKRTKAINKAKKMLLKHPMINLFSIYGLVENIIRTIQTTKTNDLSHDFLTHAFYCLSYFLILSELFQKREESKPHKIKNKKYRKRKRFTQDR